MAAPKSIVIGLVQMEVFPGEVARNGERVLEMLAAQRGAGIDLLLFPEMCLPGYLLGDMWERPAFLRECEAWTARVVEATAGSGMAAVFGTAVPDWQAKGEDGRPRKYNAFVLAQDGRALLHPGLGRPYGIKTLLPNYREFEEPRHFYDARKLAQETGRPLEDLLEPFQLTVRGEIFRAGVVICEDAWEEDYAQKPLEILGRKGCDFLLDLSCSPFTQGKNGKRNRIFRDKARRLGIPILFVNCTGSQNNGKTVFAFDGSSTAYGPDGAITAEIPPFETLTLPLRLEFPGGAVRLEGGAAPAKAAPASGGSPGPEGMREIHRALRFGTAATLRGFGQDKVVVGVSGGIDSAVSAALHRDILPPENLLLVNLPSRHNSATTRGLARELAGNLGCLYAEVGIEDSVALTRSQLDGLEAASLDGKHRVRLALSEAVLENVQARDRSSRVLATLAAAFGGVFTCNANKAELTVGYSTLYGDLGGYLAPLGDLWKGEVYALGRFLNEEVFKREVIPEGVFRLVPSAELGPTQAVDEGKGDPLVYPYHDRLFFSWVQRWNRATPEENLEWYHDGKLNAELGLKDVDAYALFPDAAAFVADLEKWWNLYNGMAVAKRVQAPPILGVSSRAFGFDHRECLGKPFYSSRYLELRKSLLENGKD